MSENNALAVRPQNTGIQAFNFFDPVQFETMQRICKMFAHSELVPDMYKVSENNPLEKAMANCMIAIEIAQRIGASPLMIMQNMVPIYGKPSWSSKFLIATVNTCGRFNTLQFRFKNFGPIGKMNYTAYDKKWIPGENGKKGYYKNEAKIVEFDGTNIDNIECVAYTSHKGSEDLLESSPVSIRLAVEEGWYTKAGSKWKTMTQQMLMYRAASFWTSAYAPELSMGMKTEDEVRDIEDIPYEDVTPPKAKANTKPIDIDEKPAEKPVDDKKEGEGKQEPKEPDIPPTANF